LTGLLTLLMATWACGAEYTYVEARVDNFFEEGEGQEEKARA
jgi:hypothetical protein